MSHRINKNNNLIAEYDSLLITDEGSCIKLFFNKINIISLVNFEVNDSIEIEFYVLDINCEIFESQKLNVGIYEGLILKVIRSDIFTKTDIKFQVNLINTWFNNEEIFNWRELSKRKKKIWNKSCLRWSKIKENFSPKENYIFNGENVNCVVDLYCYLGELFIGDKGYLGQDLDGLRDCLNSFILDKTKTYSICFKNFDHVKNALNTAKNKKKFKINYTDIFTSRGFNLIFD